MFFMRILTSHNAAKNRYLQFQRVGRAAEYKEELTWTFQNLSRESLYTCISSKLKGVVPDAQRRLVHDSATLFVDCKLKLFLDESTAKLHALFDKFIDVSTVRLSVSKNTSSMVDVLAGLVNVPYFADKRSRSSMSVSWTTPDPTGKSLMNMLLEHATTTYNHPEAPFTGCATKAEVNKILHSLQHRFLHKDENAHLRRLVQFERQLRRAVGREELLNYGGLLGTIGKAEGDGVLGILLGSFQKPTTPANDLYSIFATRLVEGLKNAVSQLQRAANLDIKKVWRSAEMAHKTSVLVTVKNVQPDTARGDVVQEGGALE
ncbi:hypothetical protein JCM5296_004233 [Sporobolomyces johnsonii]